MEINGRRLIAKNEKIIRGQGHLKFKYLNKNNNYRILYNGQSYELTKEKEYLTWNLPEDINNKDKISVKVEAIDSSNDVIFTTNAVTLDLMSNELDTISASLFYDENYKIYDMVSNFPTIPINDRKIAMPTNYQIVVSRDNVSQLLTFEIDRKFAGVDRYQKACGIKYINAKNEEGKAIAVNVLTTEDKITFGWLLDDHVAAVKGTVKFAVEFLGTNEFNQLYVWQTVPAEFKIEDGIWINDVEIEDRFPTIIEDIQIQLRFLQDMIENIEISGGGDGRNFITNPIRLGDPNSEVTGVLPSTKIDTTIRNDISTLKSDMQNKANINLSNVSNLNFLAKANEAGVGTGTGVSPVWGNITGTLTNQTDLQNVINGLQLDITDLRENSGGGGASLPSGGIDGQVLTKTANTAIWKTPIKTKSYDGETEIEVMGVIERIIALEDTVGILNEVFSDRLMGTYIGELNDVFSDRLMGV